MRRCLAQTVARDPQSAAHHFHRQTAFFLASVSALAVMAATPAFAVCTPTAGVGTPAPGTIVVCSGTTLNQNGNFGYGTGTQTGLTVQVQSGASVTGTTYGVNLPGVNVTNDGSITGIDTAGVFSTDATVTNNVGGTISGFASINTTQSATVTNAGTLNGGVFSQVTATVNNLATGVINGANTNNNNNDGISGNTVILRNAGSITALTGIISSAVTGGTVTVDNLAGGVLRGYFTGISGVGVTVTNAGTISSVTGFGITSSQPAGFLNVVNLAGGSITAPVYGVAAVGGTGLGLTNAGSITATDIGGYAVASSQAATITNNAGGILSGDTGILTTTGTSTVFNAGTITGTGGTAIQFGGANNVLTVSPGSVINGTVLGTGTDAFRLGGTGTGSFDVSAIGPAAQYRGFTSVAKTGDSTWTLAGTNSAALPVTVQQGRLAVNGSLANSPFTVVGGILGGNGTIGSVVAQSGGTIGPGNSIGTLNVAGNVTFQSGSFYQVEVNAAGQLDKIAATGTAALQGGTVQVLGTPAGGVSYGILTAAGGVTGQFASLDAPASLFLSPRLFYTPTSVSFQEVQTQTLASVASTPNEMAAAVALSGLAPANPLLIAALGQTSVASARQAFNATSGEIHAGAVTAGYEDSRLVRDAVLNRLSSLSTRDVARVPGDQSYAADIPSRILPAKAGLAATPSVYGFWAQGFGNFGETRGDGNAAALKRDTGGFVLGGDANMAGGSASPAASPRIS